jgi:hypothetical protein
LSLTSDVTNKLSRKEPRPRLRPFLPTGFDVACSIREGFTLNFGRGGNLRILQGQQRHVLIAGVLKRRHLCDQRRNDTPQIRQRQGINRV